MHLKYIKLLILKILFALGLFNLKFSFKIPRTLLPTRQKRNYSSHSNTSPPHPHTKIKISDPPPPPVNTFLKFLTLPLKLELGYMP